MKFYTASKSRNQGREAGPSSSATRRAWMLALARPGRRVRRGLGTSDETEAEPTGRAAERAAQHARALGADGPGDGHRPVRRPGGRHLLRGPGGDRGRTSRSCARGHAAARGDDGYRTVLLLGTTGAGKTTVVRQLLGTDPATERFPSTSTAKTTVADTELITTDDDIYRAVVTFVPRDEVIDYLTENVSEAALAAYRSAQRRRDHPAPARPRQPALPLQLRAGSWQRRSSTMTTSPMTSLTMTTTRIEDDIDPADYGEVDLAATTESSQRPSMR